MKFARTAGLALGLMALALPATTAHGSSTARQNASRICKAMRAELGTTAFRQAYGTNSRRSNAHGRCVSRTLRAQERAAVNAARLCKAERDADPAAFKAKYATGERSNAFGKCVSTKAKEIGDAEREAVVEAARSCKAEREAGPDAFRAKYGTNRNRSNAFGKCVSTHARAIAPEPAPVA
jgi:hypothetical protein